MARRYLFTNNFSSGEIAPEYLSRTDMDNRKSALKTGRNISIMAGGGFRRRNGTRDLVSLSGDSRLFSIGIGSAAILAIFYNTAVRFTDLNGATLQTVTGGPWLTADLHTMQVALEDDRIVLTSQNWPPQILTKTAGTWALANFAFAAGLNNGLLQPYYRFPGSTGVTIAPTAYTGGTITIVASAPLFNAAHINYRFRYVGIEFVVVAVASSTSITADVIGIFYPTITTTLVSSAGFLVGQEVAGLDSGITGICVAVPNSTSITVLLTGGYTVFDWTSSTINEKIVSPTAKSLQGASASTINGTPAATVEWDESVVNPFRGYPGSCAVHRTRLLLGNFPAAKNLLCASAIGDITDFDVGTGLDTDAVVELIGRDGSVGIRHFASTEQLLFFTQAGALYVPEQVGAPLSATNFELLKIGPENAGSPTPILVAEGMLFVEDRSGRVMGAIPTGNIRRSWQIGDLSELAFHLMGTPTEIALLAANTSTDRSILLLRSDGDLATMAYRRGDQVSAWTLWQTNGNWRSMVQANGDMYFVANRTINGVSTYRLEILDANQYGDGVVSIATAATAVPQYANQTVSVWSGTQYVGDYQLNGSGVLINFPTDYVFANLQVGFDFAATAEVVPPIDDTVGMRQKFRICRVDVEAVLSGPFQINGYDPSGWDNSVGVGGDVTPQSGRRRFRTLGRSADGTVTLTQDHGGPLQVRSITMEVTS